MLVKTSCLDVSTWMGWGERETGSHQGLPQERRRHLQPLGATCQGDGGAFCAPSHPRLPPLPVLLTEVRCPRLLSSPSSALSTS